MTEQLPRKFTFRTVVCIALAAAAVSLILGYLLREAVYKWKPWEDDTPIIVRDGSIVITSVGQPLNSFSMPDPKVLIHPKTDAKLGKLKVDGELKGFPCKDTKQCGVELVWSTGTPGYQEYTVVVGSNSGNGMTAGIVSSVPFAEYQTSRTEHSDPAKVEYTYTYPKAGKLTFREARLHKMPIRAGLPKPAPQVLCSNPGCKIEFEYK